MKEFKLFKPRAKTQIVFKEDKEDDWFVYIIHVERKSGKETSKSMIIHKDLTEYLDYYHGKGWVDFDPSNPEHSGEKIKKIKIKTDKTKLFMMPQKKK